MVEGRAGWNLRVQEEVQLGGVQAAREGSRRMGEEASLTFPFFAQWNLVLDRWRWGRGALARREKALRCLESTLGSHLPQLSLFRGTV